MLTPIAGWQNCLVDADVIWGRECLDDEGRLPVRANPFLCFGQGTFVTAYLYKWPPFLLWITFCSNWLHPLHATYVTDLLPFLNHFPIYEDSSFILKMKAVFLCEMSVFQQLCVVLKLSLLLFEKPGLKPWNLGSKLRHVGACLLTTYCHLGRLESSEQRKTCYKLKAMLTECKQSEFLKEITDLMGRGAEENSSWQVRLKGVNRSSTCLNAWWCLRLLVSCWGKIVIQPHVNAFNVKQETFCDITMIWHKGQCMRTKLLYHKSYCKTISNVHLTFRSFIFCTLSQAFDTWIGFVQDVIH